MPSTEPHPFGQRVCWSKTTDAEFPYQAQVEGAQWVIRVNDWPEHATVFSLLIDAEEVLHFDGWGEAWNRP